MSAATHAGGRPRRADAVRNRARVLEAARAVFAEKGIEAGIPEIAERAGVGKGTVYRSFATKDHLIAALAVEHLEWVERLMTEAVSAPDAWRAFVDVLERASEAHARDRALGASVTLELPELQDARERMLDALDGLVRRAQEQGAMRADVTSADVVVLWAGVGRIMGPSGIADTGPWRRYARLIAEALRAPGSCELPPGLAGRDALRETLRRSRA